MATSRLSFTFCCPIYSARTRGRSDNSYDASSSIIEPAITRSVTQLPFGQNLQRSLKQHLERWLWVSVGCTTHSTLRQCAVVSQIFQRRQNIYFDPRLRLRFGKVLQLVFQFENDPLSGF